LRDGELVDVPTDGQTMGEIVMRGNNVMKGYYRDPDATASAFAGGWFHSGDLGAMHPDGYIELRDRAKDIIISGGENISTVEVEQALVSHDAVLEAPSSACRTTSGVNGRRPLSSCAPNTQPLPTSYSNMCACVLRATRRLVRSNSSRRSPRPPPGRS